MRIGCCFGILKHVELKVLIKEIKELILTESRDICTYTNLIVSNDRGFVISNENCKINGYLP